MMEKHKCKLCFRNFSNGRALGGHMRSHMMNLHVPPKPNEPPPPAIQLSFEAESSSPPSPSSFSGEEGDKGLCYGLRENPKRSFRIGDPEFSLAPAGDTGSVILQEDRESETESSKNITRRRSRREWKLGNFNKRTKLSQHGNKNESASSVSDTTTEENLALCLMMLSRDTDNNWKKDHNNNNIKEQEQLHREDEELEEEQEEDDEEDAEEDEDEESDEYEEVKNKTKTNRVRGGRYKCETCNKVFRSYQALGGHRASHKKMKMDHRHHHHEPELVLENDYQNVNNNNNNNGFVPASSAVPTMVVDNGNSNNNKKIHECPVCFRVFASGQALGGHKRTHVINVSATTITTRAVAEVKVKAEAEAVANSKVASSAKFGRESFIDLNLPAPAEDDDDVSQFEDSAVSDAEFVNPMRVFPR